MKFFLDTASLKELQQAVSVGLLDGVTTNPSLLAKESAREGKKPDVLLREICELVSGPVSAEVLATTWEAMLEEGQKLSNLAKNIVVKLPLTRDGLKATQILTQRQGLAVNVTLCFSANQALLAAKAGATYISPFIGRLDDRSQQGMDLIRDIKTIYENYQFPTQILVASIRHPLHVLDAALIGADVATMPYAVFEKLFDHPLTDLGLEAFLKDWKLHTQTDK